MRAHSLLRSTSHKSRSAGLARSHGLTHPFTQELPAIILMHPFSFLFFYFILLQYKERNEIIVRQVNLQDGRFCGYGAADY